MNYTIKETNLGPRAPQRIYIDVGELEEDPQVSAALSVVDTMMTNSPQFRLDETLWFTLASEQTHGSANCMTRTWNSLSLLSPPAGAARNPSLPNIQKLSYILKVGKVSSIPVRIVHWFCLPLPLFPKHCL